MSQMHHFIEREANNGNNAFYNYIDVKPEKNKCTEKISSGEHQTVGREKMARVFRVIIAVLVFILVIQLSYHLYFARNVKIDRIVISSSNFQATDEQVLKMAGLNGNESYFSLKPEDVVSRLKRYPQISRVDVQKQFPGTLLIDIEGRLPLAVCLIESNGVTIPAVVDADGVLFQMGSSVKEYDLPVLSGINIANAGPGSRMPRPVSEYLKDLSKLRKESPVFFNSISELKFIKKTNDDFEVLMYPQNYSIPVRIGNGINKKLFTYIILVLDVVKEQEMSSYLEELDFRTDEVVYKVRGE